MKINRILFLVMLLCLALAICACGSPKGSDDQSTTEEEVVPECEEHVYVDRVCTVCSAISPSRGLTFALNEDKASYSVTSIGLCTDILVGIPEEHEGLPVTGIAANAFTECESIRQVGIPNSVTHIGEKAFNGCPDLLSMIVPRSVKEIGDGAFINCKKLRSVTISKGVTVIGDSAFANCSLLADVMLPSSVTEIGKSAFLNCTNLESIVIPNGVTSIEDSAFAKCESMKSVTISKNVKRIGKNAFFGCKSLTSISIPASITSIGSGAFENCTNLAYSEYDNAYYLGDDTNSYVALIKAKSTDITSCNIHGDTKFICSSAFERCASLSEITIPEKVIDIGEYAFAYCDKLDGVVIPKSVTSIDNCAFYDIFHDPIAYYAGSAAEWDQISIVSSDSDPFSATVYYYSKTAPTVNGNYWRYVSGVPAIWIGNLCPFKYEVNSGGTDCTITGYKGDWTVTGTDLVILEAIDGYKVTAIGDKAFLYCEELTSIVIPQSVKTIGSEAFWGCDNLKSINVPKSVTSIGSEAFGSCNGLKSVTLSNGITTIGSSAFEGCGYLTSITIPNSVVTIGANAFSGCGSLKNIVIPNSVKAIGAWAFYRCTNLKTVTFAKNSQLTTLSEYMFGYCENLESVIFAEGSQLKTIEFDPFFGSENLKIVTVPQSVMTVGSPFILEDVDTVYYGGTADQWEDLNISSFSSPTIYYYSKTVPSTQGNYWRYVNGVPAVWPQ